MADICLVPQVYNAERFVNTVLLDRIAGIFSSLPAQSIVFNLYTLNHIDNQTFPTIVSFLVQLYSQGICLLFQIQSGPGEVSNYQKVDSNPP